MKLYKQGTLLVGLVFVLVYILPLRIRPLFIPDEVRYAEIAREMMTRGDWVVPHLNGLFYFEKPIFGYWAHAVSLLLFGENNFAVRLPSALSSGLMALLLLRFTDLKSRTNPQQSLATLAALIFLSSLAVAGIGTFTVLDSILSLALTATLMAFFQATQAAKGSRQERLWLIISGACCGVALLTKGFLALAVPVIVIIPYLLWQGRWKDILRMSWLPILCAILVALPWSILVHLRAPDFWNFFFWHEHVKRFFSDNAQHGRPVWFFVALLPLMTIPWSFQLGSLWKGARSQAEKQPGEQHLLRFAVCWLVFPLLFFSASRGKLLTYILPCFPAIAIILAVWLDRYLAQGQRKAFNVGAIISMVFFGLLLLALPVVQIVGIKNVAAYSSWFPVLIGMSALLLTLGFFLCSYRSDKGWSKLILYALAPLPFLAVAPGLMLNVTLAKKAPSAFFAQAANGLGSDSYVISAGNVVRAVNWGLKRDDVYLLGGSGELDYGISLPAGSGRLLTLAQAKQLIISHPGKVILFAKQRDYKKWQEQLPQPHSFLENHPEGMVAVTY